MNEGRQILGHALIYDKSFIIYAQTHIHTHLYMYTSLYTINVMYYWVHEIQINYSFDCFYMLKFAVLSSPINYKRKIVASSYEF